MAVPEECSESKERIATRDAHCSRSRVHQVASKRAPNYRTAPQRFDGFAPDLQRGPGLTRGGLEAILQRAVCATAGPDGDY